MVVTKVERLEPLLLRKEWMNDLAQAVAFLESLNLAHGDLRPENILLDRNRLKLSDFDCTAEIGAPHEACMTPYGRILNSNETDQGERGSFGSLGPRTEQFALGSLYYFINYGFEVYGDRCLTEDRKERGPKVIDLLLNMVFPKLDGDPLIDGIIDKCWHNKYATVAELAAHTQTLLSLLKKPTGKILTPKQLPSPDGLWL
jgi:serine/threonine protein kinase